VVEKGNPLAPDGNRTRSLKHEDARRKEDVARN
jgi:hypothetical protein